MHQLKWRTAVFALLIFVSDAGAAAQQTLKVGDVVVGSDSSVTGFRLITQRGSVGFKVPSQWGVIAMRSQPPISVAAFQVPNHADEGTSDSTNVALTIFDLDAEAARAARSGVGKAFGADAPVTSRYKGWEIYTQQPSQGATRYTVVDGVRELPDLHAAVSVRLAWPHLSANSPTYDSDMIKMYDSLLDSVAAAPGQYSPAANEIVRRPTS